LTCYIFLFINLTYASGDKPLIVFILLNTLRVKCFLHITESAFSSDPWLKKSKAKAAKTKTKEKEKKKKEKKKKKGKDKDEQFTSALAAAGLLKKDNPVTNGGAKGGDKDAGSVLICLNVNERWHGAVVICQSCY